MSGAGERSPLAFLLAHAQARPHAPAFVDPQAGTLTYGELARGSGNAAAWLATQGVKAGDRIALSLLPGRSHALEALELFYGAGWLGAVVLPLFPDVPAAQRAPLAARYGARILEPSRYPRGGRDRPPSKRGDQPDRPFLLQFTSGTTGAPKAMILTHGQFASRTLNSTSAFGLTADDRLAPGRTWPTLVGMRHVLHMHCVGGAYLHLALPQARKDFARAIAAHGITEAATSPSSLRMLMQSEGELLALRSLRVGGAPLSAREVLEARERLCRNLVVTYGTQETETVAMLRADDPPGHDGRVGRLLPQVECEPVDGELRFRVPWMPDGYLDNPGADSARFRDGWFYPGDLGSLDPEGFVTLRGRVEEVINKGGVKILPAEIEAVLLAHPGVADAAVAGLAHETLGEVPVAFVVLRGETPLDALEHFCATRIDLTRLPVAFVHLEAIPRNAAGKIDRAPLRRVPLAGLISAKPPGRATRSNRP